MNTMTTRAAGSERNAAMTRRRLRVVAIGAAIVVNLLILATSRLFSGDFPAASVGNDNRTIGFADVAIVTLAVGLVAWGLLALLERITQRGRAIWLSGAVAVLAFSLLGPLAGVDAASKLTLASLHVGAAAIIVPLMLATGRRR